MKVKELIEKLQQFDGELNVFFSENTFSSPDIEIKDVGIDSVDYGETEHLTLWSE